MSKDLKACVIGLGNMGRNHARVLSDLANVSLVGCSDPSAPSRAAYRPGTGTRVFEDHRVMLEETKPDFVVVAVPSELHRDVACDVLARGVDVLVEKPIAKTMADADAIIDAAAKHKRKLMVGHIERFNPAVQELRRRVAANESGHIFQLHARRLSPFPARIQDVGVILDLASHDIDAMHFITGAKVVRAHGETARKAHKTCEDMVAGLLRFDNGAIGMLDVSWLSPKKLRELWVLAEGGAYLVDYLSQDLQWFKNGTVNDTWSPATHFSGAVEGDVIKTYIPKREPLRVELEAFANCLRNDEPSPMSGQEAREALRVALELLETSGKSA